jgi:integrase
MELLLAGIDLPTMALWLGHESIKTTQVYLEANLALKEAALAKTTPFDGRMARFKPKDSLLEFLRNL